MTKKTIEELLKTDIVNVKFTKVDGSERLMVCTLQESLVPKYEKKTETKRVHDPDVLSVWDLEKQGWRSFHKSSIITYSTS
jgi:translation initiation factor 6 (eIF-6)